MALRTPGSHAASQQHRRMASKILAHKLPTGDPISISCPIACAARLLPSNLSGNGKRDNKQHDPESERSRGCSIVDRAPAASLARQNPAVHDLWHGRERNAGGGGNSTGPDYICRPRAGRKPRRSLWRMTPEARMRQTPHRNQRRHASKNKQKRLRTDQRRPEQALMKNTPPFENC